MTIRPIFKTTVLLIGIACFLLNVSCINRKPKNYLRSGYPDKTLTSDSGSKEIKADIKASEAKEKKAKKVKEPKEKRGLWFFGKSKDIKTKKDSAPAASREEAVAELNDAEAFDSTTEPYRYRLKFGDSIVINLRSIPGSQPIEERIDENGNIKLDYIGTVYAVDKTAAELEDHIEQAYLDQKIYKNLSVSVQLPLKSYFIRGEVLKPGRFSLLGGVSILQAIATAGGFNDFANPKDVQILRGGKIRKVNVRDIERNPSLDVQIEEGDVIIIKRSFL